HFTLIVLTGYKILINVTQWIALFDQLLIDESIQSITSSSTYSARTRDTRFHPGRQLEQTHGLRARYLAANGGSAPLTHFSKDGRAQRRRAHRSRVPTRRLGFGLNSRTADAIGTLHPAHHPRTGGAELWYSVLPATLPFVW